MVKRYRKKRKALVPVTGNEPVRKKNKQGELPRRGRKPGSPNKYTAKMRDLILETAEGVGYDGKGKDGMLGYLKRCAEEERVAFLNAMVMASVAASAVLTMSREGGGLNSELILFPMPRLDFEYRSWQFTASKFVSSSRLIARPRRR